QAEDGIRDLIVTGVQTCALPIFKITSPRTDVKVSVDGWTMPPFMGLASWAAFTEQKTNDVMVMGDTVLFQDEVSPVMSVALDNEIGRASCRERVDIEVVGCRLAL